MLTVFLICNYKEKLVDRIKIIGKNFSALGRDFGVSDNAVRKWFLKYDLI